MGEDREEICTYILNGDTYGQADATDVFAESKTPGDTEKYDIQVVRKKEGVQVVFEGEGWGRTHVRTNEVITCMDKRTLRVRSRA